MLSASCWPGGAVVAAGSSPVPRWGLAPWLPVLPTVVAIDGVTACVVGPVS